MADEFSRSGDTRPATIDDLYAAMVDANAIVGEQRKRIAELEAALRKIVDLQTDEAPVAYSWGLAYFREAHDIAKAAISGKAE